MKPVAAHGLMNGWLGVSRDGTEVTTVTGGFHKPSFRLLGSLPSVFITKLEKVVH